MPDFSKLQINSTVYDVKDTTARSGVALNTSDIAVQTARIDNIAHLPSGSTSGDAELMDIRVGADGVTYASAGAAIRANDSALKSHLQNIEYANNIFDSSNVDIRELYINNALQILFDAPDNRLIVIPINHATKYVLSLDYGTSTKRVCTCKLVANGAYIYNNINEVVGGIKSIVINNVDDDFLCIQLFINSDTDKTASNYYNDLKLYQVPNETSAKLDAVVSNNSLLYLNTWTNNIYNYGQGERTYVTNRIGLSSVYTPIQDLYVYADSGYSISVGEFSSNDTSAATEKYRTGWTDHAILEKGKHYLINFKRNDDSYIYPERGSLNSKIHFVSEQNDVTGKLITQSMFRDGSLGNLSNLNAISFVDIMPFGRASRLKFLVDVPLASGHKYRYQFSTYSVAEGTTANNASARITVDYTIITESNVITWDSDFDHGVGIGFSLYELDENDAYVPLRVNTFDFLKIYTLFEYGNKDLANYAVSADFAKKELTYLKLGTVSGLQAFCKYNNKYYSTDGSNLYIQDADFVLENTVALSVGHGNAFQLGHDGKAYASGWDDNKVYVVDLTTNTIESTIDLPTTGYTTCAVDDINGLMYIFQRDTRPGSATEHYNMITYDYVNDNVISTKKTTRAYGAMQSCDFVDGKILILYGLGSATIPNGYMVLNTSGDIIAEYVMTAFATNEPEGVFVDRDTYDVYMSFVDQKVYKIVQL